MDLRLHPVAGLTPASVSSGRLLVRCQTATLGYWGRPDETAELTSGARLRTSDILSRVRWRLSPRGAGGRRDEVRRALAATGRRRGMPIRAPSVVEAAVIGFRSPVATLSPRRSSSLSVSRRPNTSREIFGGCSSNVSEGRVTRARHGRGSSAPALGRQARPHGSGRADRRGL